ncbi:MAG: NAD-dependent epimerase/dehydratase family protein [Bacteroides sp.]|nr:NAD-dependent epimerase/dehydratase family protein [Prevotella sp.]MCM1408560.1 NAD-dependent epimerase/dehydratase family protein [Treponema brennaborense]MCM1470726.1 NAD-dependent epimerase/dehydratase family protein [Bacteroides sp.]
MMKLTDNTIIDSDLEEIVSEPLNWEYFANKTVIITGANGMLPAYIVYALLALNDTCLKEKKCKIIANVRNYDKARIKFEKFLNRNDFQLLLKDVTELAEFCGSVDIVIHAASQASPKYYGIDPVGTLKANTIGTMNMLELAKNNKCEKFLFFSSGDVYGVLDGAVPVISETYTGNVDITNVRSCYAESKRMGETMCVCYAHQYGLHVNMLRLAHTYGPGCALDDGRVFADFVRNIINKENIRVNSDGGAKRCFMYVTDMIKALFYVLLKGKNKEAYNISSVKETSIRELAEMLCGLYPEKLLHAEFSETKDDNLYMKSKSTVGKLDTTKLCGLGWKQTVSLEDGFKRMIQSY